MIAPNYNAVLSTISGKKYVSSFWLYCALDTPPTVPYHNWIKNKVFRMATLEEGKDFVLNLSFDYDSPKRGPKPKDCYITIWLAVSICIFTNTIMAKKVKNYLECI
jgi:hypothetical protein